MSGSAMLIAMMGNKGGTGKTTLAVNMAVGLMRQAPTALLDLDPQRSAWQWSRIAEQPAHAAHVYECHDTVREVVANLKERYQYLVLDCPPSVHARETRDALGLCDHVLVPVQPSPLDLWASLSVVEAVSAARREHPRLKAHIVLNQLEAQTVLSRDIREVIDEVGLAVLRSEVRRRAIYRNAMAEGKTVFDMGGAGREAAAEIERLLTEVIAS